MKEKTKNTMWGCLTLVIIAAVLFCTAYGAVTLFNNLLGL